MASASWSCQGTPASKLSLSNQTFRPHSCAAGASSMRCFSLRVASVSAPAWLRNRRGVGWSHILVRGTARECGLGLLAFRRFATPVLPIDLLLLSNDGLNLFHKAQIRLVLLHVAVSARPVHVEPLL